MNHEEFLADLVNFLESRGHGRLIPPTGVDAFPEVVLNGKRLDLYNLYREVLYFGSRSMYEVLGFVSGVWIHHSSTECCSVGCLESRTLRIRIKTRCFMLLLHFRLGDQN